MEEPIEDVPASVPTPTPAPVQCIPGMGLGGRGSGRLAWEQEGGEHESGEAFLMTVSSSVSPAYNTNVNY